MEAFAAVAAVLEDAQRLGYLGANVPVADQIEHARGFRACWADHEAPGTHPGTVVDLGSGGGLPGLVLAVEFPVARFVLLDARRQRIEFLQDAVVRLGWRDRVIPVHGRAEDVARGPYREAADLVVARSFGAPAVTAECAVGFLRAGGALVVSEPPEPRDRWATPGAVAGLEELGLTPEPSPLGFQVLRRGPVLSDRFPRRPGIPEKRPLF